MLLKIFGMELDKIMIWQVKWHEGHSNGKSSPLKHPPVTTNRAKHGEKHIALQSGQARIEILCNVHVDSSVKGVKSIDAIETLALSIIVNIRQLHVNNSNTESQAYWADSTNITTTSVDLALWYRPRRQDLN